MTINELIAKLQKLPDKDSLVGIPSYDSDGHKNYGYFIDIVTITAGQNYWSEMKGYIFDYE